MVTGRDSSDVAAMFGCASEDETDAAHAILTKPSREFTGKFCLDDEVLRAAGTTDFTQYRDAGIREEDLLPDFFL